jgi:glycosyltransferase involved in cell wall biosynthesis
VPAKRTDIEGDALMRIAIIGRDDVGNIGSSSGYSYFMAKALQKHVGEVEFLSPDQTLSSRMIEKCGRALNRASFRILHRHLAGDQYRVLSWRLAHVFSSRVPGRHFDVIFAPNASVEIASLQTDIPIVYSTDQNWANMANYYPNMTSMFSFAEREADGIEAAALRNASAVLYPSSWAANTAITHYGAPPDKVHVVPWGANMYFEEVPQREAVSQRKWVDEVLLLWIGVDWDRKGGAIAFDCLIDLLQKGVSARLTICGCIPPERFRHPRITVIPFLDKRKPTERAKLSQLFMDAHFFVFPTMAEAYGIVLCESSAHGLPSIVRNTGGVGGAIEDGQNGCLMAPEAQGKDYAEKIMKILHTPGRYQEFVQASRDAYETRLNWDAWGRSVNPIFKSAAGTIHHRMESNWTRSMERVEVS